MPIRITCPHCKRGMLVDERLAGKTGKCKACQQPITVPSLPTSNSTKAEAAPTQAQTAAPPADVEAEAAALFADEEKPAEPVEVKTIDLNCPFCDEAIHLPADLAGKRAQCPECKQIIKVPELVKKDPKDWRKVEARGPTGARLPDQPALEGAWGSVTAGSVGKQSLQEAGVIPTVQRPRPPWQKPRWPVIAASVLFVLGAGGLIVYSWWGRRAVEREVVAAVKFADAEAQAETKAALYLGAAEYYLRSRKEHPDPNTGASTPAGKAANNQFGKALTTLSSASQGEERDALLTDLALAEIELGGDKQEALQELRLSWDKVQQLLLPTLGAIQNAEAKLYALRAVAVALRRHGEATRALQLANQLYSTPDADKAAALSVVGLEFFKAGDRPSADRAAETALQLYPKDVKAKEAKALPLRPEVVTLALLLDKKTPPAQEDNPDDKASELIGKAEALARQDKWDEARKQAGRADDPVVQLRARLAIADAAVDAKLPDTTDIESAIKLAEGDPVKNEELSWTMLHLTTIAVQTGLPEDRVQAFADQIENPALRGRAQLAVFRTRLDKANQAVEDSAADKIDGKSLARSLAAQALARHNAHRNAGYGGVVQTWPEPSRWFGALGVALGLQDRGK